MKRFTKLLLALTLCVLGVGSVNAGNHYLEITTNSVKENTWAWAIKYTLSTPLVNGKTYVLSMDAKCSEDFNIAFWPNKTGGATLYTGYSIGTTWTNCVCEFTANDDLNVLSWDFGSLNGKLYFDNVVLVEKGTNTNLISGGDFESGLDAGWGDDGWNSPVYSIYESQSTTSGRYLKIWTNSSKTNAWEWAIWYQLDTPLETDKTYVLSMKAKCSENYNMAFWPVNTAEGGKTLYTGYSIGTEWSNCTCTFTANDNLNRLVWDFGPLNGTLYFDDIQLVEQGTTTNLIKDGGFDGSLVSNWGNDGWNKPNYGIALEYPELKAEVQMPEVQLTKSMFKEWSSPDADATITSNYPFWNALDYGQSSSSGSVIYGNSNVAYLNYADLSAYSALKVYGTGANLRILMNRVADNGALTEVQVSPSVDGTILDLSSYGFVHLNAIKVVNGGGETVISNITLIDPNASSVDYVIFGDYKDGEVTTSFTSALSDVTAKSIDVTGLKGSGIELVSANPNCLFVANAGTLSNTKNVIVDDVCDNLVLTDGYPFKAPANFTATAASYSTTINDEAKAGTLCLPFAATIPEGVEAYTLTYTSGATVTAAKIDGTIPANTPVLLNGEGDVTFTGAGAVSATATNAGGALTGVFEETAVPENSFVLQNGGSGLGFYKVASTAIYANPFRAYLTAQAEARCLNIVFADEEENVTGIQTVKAAKNNGMIFNLNGQRMNKLNKGLNIIGGKKLMVK